ncbi:MULTISPECIES: type II toxin-antitoxin system RelE family toxin [Dethiosulfovibrio]|uniref:Type II toxin-antitoxin system RelE/ParE family toxin n=2 Tax=Dethiosulfovibrio TaxID=47054 RepID=A0ABS9EPQ1_9BACT|nr:MULTISPECIES: type II toxin-antitoxin system RelE/ParE family toxin [Dethiosulfovibrio]MCF4113182.1 type II toxin-antitoxin system RelE/ParE family toxin [Dethiosulfovibrio russensis]MCF4142246.1 type II toxin-antitoxin system RelE/ParE family toxin [Dethiosulfovibrio marinus]MCF4144554.1 type II toxin-antitoxin system RelE/ParE family toxin [Dethiosulfovibrio acidaminovorans]
MAWTIELSSKARKELEALSNEDRKRVGSYLDELLTLETPRDRGRALTGNFRGYWRYRIGDIRVICDIEDERFVIIALRIDRRSQVYRRSLPRRIRGRYGK